MCGGFHEARPAVKGEGKSEVGSNTDGPGRFVNPFDQPDNISHDPDPAGSPKEQGGEM